MLMIFLIYVITVYIVIVCTKLNIYYSCEALSNKVRSKHCVSFHHSSSEHCDSDLSLTFDLDAVRMFCKVILKTYFSYDNDICISTTDCYLCQGDIIS